MLYGAIAGTIPDLDILLNFVTDEISAMAMHRGFSHSLLFCLLMAPILGWIIYKWDRRTKVSLKEWMLMFFLVLVTHPLLDAHTTWGTQFFWPFEIRLAYNNIFVIDPLYTVPFLALVIAAMFYNRTSPKRRKINKAALIISSGYMLLTIVFKGICYYKVKSALEEENIQYKTIVTRPTPLNAILWSIQVETESGYRTAYYSLFDTRPISFFSEIPKNHSLLDAHKNQKDIRQIIQMSRGYYFLEEIENGFMYTDMRFGQMGFSENSPFGWRYKLTKNPAGKLSIKKLDFPAGSASLYEAFKSLLERIKGV
jgi:inner membrane protein